MPTHELSCGKESISFRGEAALECGGASRRFQTRPVTASPKFMNSATRYQARSKAVAGATAVQSASREIAARAAREISTPARTATHELSRRRESVSFRGEAALEC